MSRPRFYKTSEQLELQCRALFGKVQLILSIVTVATLFVLASALIASTLYPTSYDSEVFTNTLLILSFVGGTFGILWILSWLLEDWI